MRNATHLRTFCVLEVIFAFGEIFVNQRVLWHLYLHWRQPKLPWGKQRICGPFVLKTIITNHFAFRETLCPVPLAIRSLYFIQVYIFFTSDIIPPHSCAFHTFCLHQFFHMYITMRNIFLIPNDAIDRRKLGIQFLFLILAVKGPTWTIVYFLKFIVLNYTDFHKI